tara:strand:- start:2337 stop:2831 length:495 start_codon:yes stop_codon:yes gene_type:complete
MTTEKKINIPMSMVKTLVEPLFIKSVRDKQFVVDALLSMVPEQQLVMFLEIANMQSYKTLEKGMHIRFKRTKFYGSDYDADIMVDKGLLKKGYLYGYIENDDSYHIEFNPYESRMKVKYYVWSDNKIILLDDTVNTLDIEEFPKENITFFKLEDAMKHDEVIEL